MNKIRSILILFIIFSVSLTAQDQLIVVVGDQLEGFNINDKPVREVIGNVVITQGDVRITCKKAIHYITENNAELIGDVVLTQGNVTITTEVGHYYGNEKRAYSDTGVVFDDKQVVLEAKIGEYLFDEAVATFIGDVNLYDSVTTMTSRELIYYREERRAVAIDDVVIKDSVNTIAADSIVHYRGSKNTFAFFNVAINNTTDNIKIFSDHLEDYRSRLYTFIDEKPLLIQLDTSEAGVIDTFIIRSKTMEAYRDTSSRYIAKDSVRMVRGSFSSVNELTVYYKTKDILVTEKEEEDDPFPVLWYENSQMTGDSVTLVLKENKFEKLLVHRNALAVSRSVDYPDRYDQVSGQVMTLYFEEGKMTRTDVGGGVLSIYYMYENGLRNGLIKASAESAKIYFDEDQVSQVRLYGDPNGEFHPENLVRGNEKSFFLPNFIEFKKPPRKEELLKGYEENIF